MDEILQFIAIEAVRLREGNYRTTITFTTAAVDIIREACEIDEEELEQIVTAMVDQNLVAWNSLEEEQQEMLVDSVIDQIACEQFTVEQMGIDDYIEMEHTSDFNGEVQVILITKEEIGYV